MNPLEELKAAVQSMRLSGDAKLIAMADKVDALIAGLGDNPSDEAVAGFAAGLAAELEATNDIDDIFAEAGLPDYDEEDELAEEIAEALYDRAGGGWQPDEYIAVVETVSGQPIPAPAREQLIAAFAAQARAVIGTFEPVSHTSVGNKLYLRVQFDLATIVETTGVEDTRAVIADTVSAAEVPGLGVVLVSAVIPLVTEEAAATQRRGANQLRDIAAR